MIPILVNTNLVPRAPKTREKFPGDEVESIPKIHPCSPRIRTGSRKVVSSNLIWGSDFSEFPFDNAWHLSFSYVLILIKVSVGDFTRTFHLTIKNNNKNLTREQHSANCICKTCLFSDAFRLANTDFFREFYNNI